MSKHNQVSLTYLIQKSLEHRYRKDSGGISAQ